MKSLKFMSVLVLICLSALPAPAQIINGINWFLHNEDGTAILSSDAYPETDNIVIPASVSYRGKSYKVTSANASNARVSITIPPTLKSLSGINGKIVKISSLPGFAKCEKIDDDYRLMLSGTEIKHLALPNSWSSIPKGAFHGCSSLVSVTIPASVKSIGNYAFFECKNLQRVNVGSLKTWLSIKFDGTVGKAPL